MKKTVVIVSMFVSFTAGKLLANNMEKISTPKEVVQEYFEDLQSGNFQALMNLFAEDVIWHQPGNNILSKTYHGKEELGALFGKFMEISKGTFRIDDVMFIAANGNMVSATLNFSARRCQYIDVSMSMKGVDLMRIENGKIKEVFLFSEDQEKEDYFWGIDSSASRKDNEQ